MATIMSGAGESEFFSSVIECPPYKATVLYPVAMSRTTLYICITSSRDGAIITALTSAEGLPRVCSKAMAKATVLPEPVGDSNSMSRAPEFMTSCCMGLRVSIPRRDFILSIITDCFIELCIINLYFTKIRKYEQKMPVEEISYCISYNKLLLNVNYSGHVAVKHDCLQNFC